MQFIKPFKRKPKLELVSHGYNTNFTIGQNDQIFVTYTYKGCLYLAKKIADSKWDIMPIEEISSLIGSCPSIAIDNENRVHIAYCDMDRTIDGVRYGALCYAVIENGKMSINVLDKGWPNYCGVYPSLAISNSGNIAITYHYDGSGHKDKNQELIKIATWDKNKWEIKPVKQSEHGGHRSFVIFDEHDNLHIAFNSTESLGSWINGPIYYAYGNNDDFKIEEVFKGFAIQPSMILDGKGIPRISYVFESEDKKEYLGYAVKKNNSWIVSDLGLSAYSSSGGTSSIAINKEGFPMIAFNDGELLKLATFNGNTWQAETIWENKSRDSWKNPLCPVNPVTKVDKNGNSLICFSQYSVISNHEVCLIHM